MTIETFRENIRFACEEHANQLERIERGFWIKIQNSIISESLEENGTVPEEYFRIMTEESEKIKERIKKLSNPFQGVTS